jgi:hypothetical protein
VEASVCLSEWKKQRMINLDETKLSLMLVKFDDSYISCITN